MKPIGSGRMTATAPASAARSSSAGWSGISSPLAWSAACSPDDSKAAQSSAKRWLTCR